MITPLHAISSSPHSSWRSILSASRALSTRSFVLCLLFRRAIRYFPVSGVLTCIDSSFSDVLLFIGISFLQLHASYISELFVSFPLCLSHASCFAYNLAHHSSDKRPYLHIYFSTYTHTNYYHAANMLASEPCVLPTSRQPFFLLPCHFTVAQSLGVLPLHATFFSSASRSSHRCFCVLFLSDTTSTTHCFHFSLVHSFSRLLYC